MVGSTGPRHEGRVEKSPSLRRLPPSPFDPQGFRPWSGANGGFRSRLRSPWARPRGMQRAAAGQRDPAPVPSPANRAPGAARVWRAAPGGTGPCAGGLPCRPGRRSVWQTAGAPAHRDDPAETRRPIRSRSLQVGVAAHVEAIGIVDVGSNTVRLSIVEVRPDGAHQVRYEAKAGLRLAARLGKDGRLGQEAALETARVLTEFAWAGTDWGVSEWLAVATAAVRQATDGAEFLETVSRLSGMPLRLLDGGAEAALGLVGALNTLAEPAGYLIDIGGASTEITRFEDRRLVRSVSLPLGAVNAMRTFGLADRCAPGALRALEKALEAAVAAVGNKDEATAWIEPQPDRTLVVLGGTVRTLAKLDRRRRKYPFDATHNYLLAPAAVTALRDRLAAIPAHERARLPGLGADRADLIVAGAAILGWLVARTAPRRLVVSGSGLREGLFYSRLLRDRADHLHDSVLEASSRNLVLLYGLPVGRSERLAALAAALWDILGAAAAAPAGVGRLVSAAARLRGVGSAISFYDWARHTAYLVREARLFGCDHRERVLLAAAAPYEGVGRLREALAPFTALLEAGDLQLAVRMGLCVALAEALDRDARGRALPLRASVLPSAVRLSVPGWTASGASRALALAEDCRKWFGKAVVVTGAEP